MMPPKPKPKLKSKPKQKPRTKTSVKAVASNRTSVVVNVNTDRKRPATANTSAPAKPRVAGRGSVGQARYTFSHVPPAMTPTAFGIESIRRDIADLKNARSNAPTEAARLAKQMAEVATSSEPEPLPKMNPIQKSAIKVQEWLRNPAFSSTAGSSTQRWNRNLFSLSGDSNDGSEWTPGKAGSAHF